MTTRFLNNASKLLWMDPNNAGHIYEPDEIVLSDGDRRGGIVERVVLEKTGALKMQTVYLVQVKP